ncbi:hypothetical protein CAter10_4104 [Collimonas arenae]|nr:hypothetical protein CAter10_4104 [Collimonas arenae]
MLHGATQLFIPVAIVTCLLILLYVPEQMVALTRSLTAIFSQRGDVPSNSGFYGSDGLVYAWWFFSSAVILTASLYLKPRVVNGAGR